MKNKNPFFLLIFVIFFSLTSSLFALPYDFGLSFEPLYTRQKGTLYEYVIAKDETSGDDVKMSQLDWNLKNLSYLGARFSLDWKYVSLITEVSATISKDSGTMEDYDWLDFTSKTTESGDVLYYYNDSSLCTTKSINENYIDDSVFLDLKIRGNLNPIFDLQINPFVGLHYYYISFRACNGYGWYGSSYYSSTGKNVSYDDPAALAIEAGNLFGLDYSRRAFTCYFGAAIGYKFFNRISLSFYGSLSPYSYIDSLDFHHSDFAGTKGNFYYDVMSDFFKEFQLGGYIECLIWDKISFEVSVDYYRQKLIKGTTKIASNRNMKAATTSSTASGSEAKYWNLKFGLKWTFD